MTDTVAPSTSGTEPIGMLLRRAASAIADAAMRDADPATPIFLVGDRALLQSDWSYRTIKGELEALIPALAEATGLLTEPASLDAVPDEPPVWLDIVRPLASVLARRDDSVIAAPGLERRVTPLITAVAGALAEEHGAHVVVDGFDIADSALVDAFFGAKHQRDALAATLAAFQAEHVVTPVAGEDLMVVRGREALAKAIIERFDAFAALATKPPEGTTLSPLAAAAARARLHEMEVAPDVLFVELKPFEAERIVCWMRLNGATGEIVRASTVSLVESGGV